MDTRAASRSDAASRSEQRRASCGALKAGGVMLYEWTFSATAEWVVGLLLAAVIVTLLFV
jgi:hypothetical protein